MKRVKTLLIEDSGLMRIMISDALRTDRELQLVGTAANGKLGYEKVLELKPDVVVTDLLMPDYDGLYAVKKIMSNRPTPVIILSSLGKTTPEIFDALDAGAVDFIDKPRTKEPSAFKLGLDKLKQKIKMSSGIELDSLLIEKKKSNTHTHTFGKHLNYEIVAIGSSTGGPSAIESIITRLPENLPIPVVIAQHMPDRFVTSFAERLNALIPLHVQVAMPGQRLKAKSIYIMPGSANLAVKLDQNEVPFFKVSDKRYSEFNDPSVDCLFESVAESYKAKSMGIIMTGMGKDGSQGLLKIKNNGGMTIAQDEASSVVYGMPLEAKKIGAVNHTVSLNDIPGFVMSCF